MTLEEAIWKEKALAYSFRKRIEDMETTNPTPLEDMEKEHLQYAEWLRELNAYRKAEKEIEQELVNWNDIDNGKCRGLFLATSIIQNYKNEEVNADA